MLPGPGRQPLELAARLGRQGLCLTGGSGDPVDLIHLQVLGPSLWRLHRMHVEEHAEADRAAEAGFYDHVRSATRQRSR